MVGKKRLVAKSKSNDAGTRAVKPPNRCPGAPEHQQTPIGHPVGQQFQPSTSAGPSSAESSGSGVPTRDDSVAPVVPGSAAVPGSAYQGPEVDDADAARARREERKTACLVCGKRILHVAGHMRRIHGIVPGRDDRIACTMCPKSFVSHADLRKHQIWHSIEMPYMYDRCEACYTSKKLLAQHRLEKHVDVYRYTCYVCPCKFRFVDQLKDHKQKFHIQSFPHKCKLCNKVYKTANFLKRHNNTKHPLTV